MTTQLIRALTGTVDQPELTFRRRYRTTVADLREACTDPTRLARWFGTIEGAPAGVGDRYVAVLGDDPEDVAQGKVEACLEDGFDVSWQWQGEAPSVISVRFEPDADAAWLTLQHRLEEAQHATGYGGGWEQLLHALARTFGEPVEGLNADVEAAAAAEWARLRSHPLDLDKQIPAPLPDVWTAFTTAGGLKRWWWKHWPDTTVAADAQPGGHYRIETPSMGLCVHGRYLVVDEPNRLAFTWAWSDADGTSAGEAVDIRLEPDGDGTRVTVRHTGPWVDGQAAENYRQGWEFTLAQLAETLA